MADNVVADAGTGGATFAADDIAGIHYPRSKIVIGADGSNDGDVSSANPMPIAGTVTANAGTNLNTSALALEAGGNLAAAAASLATIDADTGTLAVVGNGAAATAQRVTLANDSTGVIAAVTAVTAITNALPAGTNNIGDVDAIQSGTWTVQPGNTANTTPWLTSERPATSGGLTMHKTVSAASTNATSVKGSAGQIYGIQCSNVNAEERYLKLYNKATAPTVGTDTPVKTLIIPGGATGAGFVISWPNGLEFTTGIAFALTTEATDAGTTGVSASEHVVNIDYK